MREKVLEKIQKESQKKVMMNFHIDPYLKSSFEDACKYDGVSMSSAIIAMIETYIEDANEEKYKSIRTYYKRVTEELPNEIKSEQDLTPERLEEIRFLKQKIQDFLDKHQIETIPETNNWNYTMVLGLNMLITNLDAYQYFYKKDKK